jgi:hypothetical protein
VAGIISVNNLPYHDHREADYYLRDVKKKLIRIHPSTHRGLMVIGGLVGNRG